MTRISDRRKGERRKVERRAASPAATLPAATLPAATLPAATLPAATLPAATLPAATLPDRTEPLRPAQSDAVPSSTAPPGSPVVATPASERREQASRRQEERRGAPRRAEPRVTAVVRVDLRCEGNFLYAYASNVSMLGIFLQTNTPMPQGAPVELIFDAAADGFALQGTVAWVNPYKEGGENTNPGMGIRFLDVDPPRRERLLQLVRRIAYLGSDSSCGQA